MRPMTHIILLLSLLAGCACGKWWTEPVKILDIQTTIIKPLANEGSLADKSNEAWQRRQALVNDDSILAHISRIEMILNRWERGKVSDADREKAKAMSHGTEKKP